MAREKQITVSKLKKLGVARLAALMEACCDDDPILAKRIRLLLSAEEGEDKLNAAIRKRIASIARSRAFVDWRKCTTYVRELDDLREAISTQLAGVALLDAIEQMWNFIDLSRNVLDRLEDDHGYASDVFASAVEDLGKLCLKQENLDEIALADRVFGVFTDDVSDIKYLIVEAMGKALGAKGRHHLKTLLEAAILAAPTGRNWGLTAALKNLADADGDVDAYIKATVKDPENIPFQAPAIAKRLLAAGRATEALDWLDKPGKQRRGDETESIDLRIEALEALDRRTEAQTIRITHFEKTLSTAHLRQHLKYLPDFDDFESEQRAISHAEAFPQALTALSFLVHWPNLEAANRLVKARQQEINGADYTTLNDAADHLSEKYPDAATLLYRKKVESVLNRAASKYYHHAIRDLGDCAALESRITPSNTFLGHDDYVASLREKHGRKYSFWNQWEKSQ